MPAPENTYEHLRRLAVEDPIEAKKVFLGIFEANSEELDELLVQLGRPNEGRLRQVVANAVRAHPDKIRIVPTLLQWRSSESDEFTRRAIDGALADVDLPAMQSGKPHRAISIPNQLADTYRYVSDRLRHRLRNTMLSAQAQTNRLKSLIAADSAVDAQATLAKLNDAMTALGRELEATDVAPEYFHQRSIVLADWLQQMNSRYAAQYREVGLRLINADNPRCRVFATDYLLDTIFWNIWINAHQAVGVGCEITVEFQVEESDLTLNIFDNGQGFPPELKDVVFQQMYSTKNPGRGRGMLEIQDATERMGGRVELFEYKAREYRIRLHLPLELQ